MQKQGITLFFAGATLLASCASTSKSSENGEVRRFEVRNAFVIDVPASAQRTQAWLALPDDHEELQDVGELRIRATSSGGSKLDTREVRDAAGNRFLYLEREGLGGERLTIETTFDITRREAIASVDPERTRPLTAAELDSHAQNLGEATQIVITPRIRAEAANVVGDERNPIRQARLLYDWTLDHVQYWVKAPDRLKSSGVGSSTYCYEECTGNCTDFHSLYTAAARSIGLPTRMVYGSFFKEPLDGEPKDQSYHCWIEFWAPELGWIPLDVAVADLYVDDFEVSEANAQMVALTLADGYAGPDPERVDYYFGNLDARRVTWNRGRDLALNPTPAAGAINALPKAHVEFDGQPGREKADWTRTLTFVEQR